MRRNILYGAIAILTFLATSFAYAQPIKDRIQQAYEQFMQSGKLPSGIVSFTVLDNKTGAIVFAKNPTTGLPTASTMKVITAITVLDILGPDHTYSTTLNYTGNIDSAGVLNGDIIIQGSGDPTLGSDRYADTQAERILDKWVNKIRATGIRHINGHVIADDLYFNGNDTPDTWTWGDIGNYYGAGISGLNWRENKVGLRFYTGNIGQQAKLSFPAELPSGTTLINEVKTGPNGSGDNVYAYSAPYSEIVYLRGTHGKDLRKKIEIALPDPALALAQQLTSGLEKIGISVDSLPTTGKRLTNQGALLPTSFTSLDTHQSPPLKDILYWFNQKSINLYGEALLKSFGLIAHNTFNTQEAASLVSKYWEQKLQIPTSEMKIHDGSGLSPQNHVTTLAMAKIMRYARTRPWYPVLEKSLPTINGITMKSGTIGGSLGYTGFHKKGETSLTFSLLVNNYVGSAAAMRQTMFHLLNSLK